MSSTGPTGTQQGGQVLPPIQDGAYSGVLWSRLIAYVIDLVMILIFTGILGFAIFVVGIVTLGLGWFLFPLLAGSGVLYSAITVGGRKQSTLGMRMMGLKVVTSSGRAPDFIGAAIHSLLFYIAATTMLLLAIDILIGLARRDRRLGHDLVVDYVVVNAR